MPCADIGTYTISGSHGTVGKLPKLEELSSGMNVIVSPRIPEGIHVGNGFPVAIEDP
jgi:hypothetical protein